MRALVEDKGLLQISDPDALAAIVDTVLTANAKQLEQYRGGKTKLQGFFVGCASDVHIAHLTAEHSAAHSWTPRNSHSHLL